MEELVTNKNMAITCTSTALVTNVPKREESRAKRHFEKLEINNVKRWKCNYCGTNYGLTTSTSSLWKHLENKHLGKLSSKDIKQKSGHEAGDKCAKSAEATKSSSNPLHDHGLGSNVEDTSVSVEHSSEHSLIVSLDARKRKCYDDDDDNLIIPYNNENKVAPKRYLAGEAQELFVPPGQASSSGASSATTFGFLNLVTDIATIQPAQFEQFQDLLVQNVFLQPSGPYIFPNVDNVDVMRDRILSTQRDRVIDIVGQQCGWKFDMNIYPVFLKQKTYLMLDLIFRNKKQLHQSCFLDCLEMPDKFPTEMLSLMIFRRLCEFRVENRLWQLFIGDASLKGLAETLRKIFLDNKLTDTLECQTVDFFNHNFTVHAEEHNDCLEDLIHKVDQCVIQLEDIRNNFTNSTESFGRASLMTTFPHNVHSNAVVTSETLVEIEEQLESLKIGGGQFQKDMKSINWWFKHHLFLAYHLCNHCYYLCSDVKRHKETVDELSEKLSYLSFGLRSWDEKREQWLLTEDLNNRITNWTALLLWWKRKSQEYQQLRHTVLNFVSSNDNTTSFTQQFSKMSLVSPHLIPNDRWMKYTFWQIWKNFEKKDIAK